MIDYIKIQIKNIDPTPLFSKLDAILEVSNSTGQIFRKVLKIHHCTIKIINNDLIEFTGSIHKLYNSINGNEKKFNNTKNGFNGNDFTINQIVEVRKYLSNLFNCTPQQMIFLNCETGINLNINYNPRKFVKGLLFHNNKSFIFKYQRNYAQVEHQRYFIKIYNKSMQYAINDNILRIELKFRKSIELHNLGIKTLNDINTSTLEEAKKLILQRLSEIVYFDYTIRKNELSKPKQNALYRYSNIDYWLDELKPNHRHREKEKLAKLIANNSDSLKEKIKEQIVKKCVIINHLKPLVENQKCVIINTLNIELPITQLDLFNTKYIPSEKKENKASTRKCLITGLGLELENKDAKYIRTKTLKYLQKNEKQIFKILVEDLLNKSYDRPKIENNLITHLAKQIRNRYYNRTSYKSKKKYIYSHQLTLM